MLNKGKLKGKRNPSRGFSLIELMITVVILVIVLIGLLQLFIYCLSLAQMAGNLTIAITEAQGKLEEIRNHSFDSIAADYAQDGSLGNIFNLNRLNGIGVIYIDDTNSELLEIEIVVSWRSTGNRIIGEDNGSGTGGIPLDGQLNGTEDANGNNKLDSPTSLVSLIAKR